jgi:DNA repair exonuclease SbcCD ATPase subunit
MGFTIGDIIVLLVVVVILAVYRQTDRNNRSLDKVKRFVERVQGEMDEIVAEKVTMLKDIGIEVDVHQKAAKEVLKRINTIEEDLNSRTGSLEEIGSRLTQYENVLDQLVEMTRRTEENIGRVRDESEYVDKVGKRIKATQDKIGELERSLPGIVSGFEKQNEERLGQLEERFFASSEQRVQALTSRVEGAGTRVQEFQEEVVRLQGDTEEYVTRSRRELEELYDSLNADAREAVASIAGTTIRDVEARSQEIREVLDTAEERGRAFHAESEQIVQALQDSLERSVAGARDSLDRLAEQGEHLETESLAALRDHIERQSEAVMQEMARRADELDGENARQLAALRDTLNDRYGRMDEDLSVRLQGVSGQIEEKVARTKSELTSEISSITDTFENLSTDVEASSSRIDETIRALNERVGTVDQAVAERTKAIRERLEEHARQTTEEIESERQRLSDATDRLSAAAMAAEQDITAMEGRLTGKIDGTAQEMETRILSDLERRLEDYEKGLNYRFTKIESVNSDVDQLEEQLRTTMDRISERVRGDFLAFGEELRELREQDRGDAEASMDALRHAMDELENGLNELKQRAYENVSEKLKVFEDEFFTDLRSRSDAMDSRIEQWRQDVETRLAGMRETGDRERNALEEQYNDELRARILQFQEQITGQLNKSDEQIDSFRSGLQSRMEAVDEQFAGFESSIREELDSLKDRSFQTFRKEFTQADDRAREDLRNFEAEVEEQIGSIRSAVKNGTSDLESMIESSRSDIAVWQTEVLNQLRSGSADVNTQLADTKVRLSENLQELKREFGEEREELVEESREERVRVRNDLNDISGSLEKLEHRLENLSGQAVEEFQDRYRTLRQNIEDHESTVTERLDERSAEFRDLVEDTRGQFQAMRERLLGKLEEEARTLETTLTEIDKRQRAFIEQTKIFDRADTLKVSLTDSIEELKNEIARVEGLRGEVRDIEGQFAKIRKMSAEAGEKMARFAADKRRIDLLEEDYKRLIGLAQSVEQKIDHVGNSDEQLQEITARLKSLDELESEVESRFDRLEKRRGLIDQTADGLESNSQALAAMEARMQELTGQIESMPGTVEALAGQLRKVAAARKETDQAVGQLARLEQTLADVESRMQELQTAREWLARTETRLEEIRRDAGEQVKLLGSLMREETRKQPVDGGAPSLSARETVQKLAHQGWKVDEIARATKVSKGEVELILELTGKK